MRKIWIILLSVSFLYADWDPAYCLPDSDQSLLEDPIFQKLKWDMKQSLATSWCSAEKVDLIMDLIYLTQPELCVEIGTLTGSTALPILNALRYAQSGNLVAIDAWSNAVAIQNMAPDDPNRPWWSTINMTWAYQTFEQELETRSLFAFCNILRTTSENAVFFVGDNIDFLHLDGDYSEKGSLRDVELYLPKVKPGGYILLSNVFVMVNGKAPKMKSFSKLFEECEMLCEIDRDNAVLFRKN